MSELIRFTVLVTIVLLFSPVILTGAITFIVIRTFRVGYNQMESILNWLTK